MKRLALVLLFLASPCAWAVYVGSSGFGQALIYPYYTVQSVDGNAFNTYFSVVNGYSQPKALRVRLREGRNGREVAGFNLFLEPGGIWAAAIAPLDSGAALVTVDPACTAPAFAPLSGSAKQLVLSTAAFAGANADGMGVGQERLREGYIEVMEMASFAASTLPSCDNLRANQTGVLSAPQGYLYGMATVINVMSGMDFTENAVALGNLAQAPYFRPPGDPYPDFTAAEIGKVAMFTRNDKMYRITLADGLAAVETALVVARLDNELVLDAGTASATDWIVTMPTKRFHTAARSSPWFTAASDDAGAVRMHGQLHTRSGAGRYLILFCGFLCPGGVTEMEIKARWSASVLGFRARGLSTSSVGTAAEGTTGALGSRNGWILDLPMDPGGARLELSFYNQTRAGPPSVTLTALTTRIGDGAVASEQIQLTGVPAVGFMARTFRNGALACAGGTCQGNYGGSSMHRLRRVVDPANDP